jgi:acetyltransferase-like isoleucine patch superfamily enzyme
MRLKDLLKNGVRSSPLIERLAALLVNRMLGRNSIHIRGTGNRIDGLDRCFMFKTRITVRGTGNVVTIGRHSVLRECRIQICGDANSLRLGERTRATDCEIWLEDSRNRVSFGEDTVVCERTFIAASEGTAITVGANCLFSSDLTIRSSDSHSIVSKATGVRINPARDIKIGDHVWIGHKVIVLKGSRLGSHSIVASGSVVAGRHFQTNVIVGGNPSHVLRAGVDWVAEQLPVVPSSEPDANQGP